MVDGRSRTRTRSRDDSAEPIANMWSDEELVHEDSIAGVEEQRQRGWGRERSSRDSKTRAASGQAVTVAA